MGRRLSIKEMNMIKHGDEVRNSRVNRGEIKETEGGRHHIIVCGCGAEGCAFHAHTPHNPYLIAPLNGLVKNALDFTE